MDLHDPEIFYILLLSFATGYYYSVGEYVSRLFLDKYLGQNVTMVIKTGLMLLLLIVSPAYFILTVLAIITGTIGGYEGKKSYEKFQYRCDNFNLNQQENDYDYIFAG